MLTFYTNPMSRGRIVRWMLEEVGQPYDTFVLDYGTTMKAPAYLAVNPMGKVPSVVHDGQVVTEGGAICTYLAEAFPEVGLMPAQRAAFYRWIFFGAGPLEQAVTNGAMGWVVPPERERTVGYGSMGNVLATLSAHLGANRYFCGEQFTAVDIYVGSQIGWGLGFKTLPAMPELEAYWARIKTRPALARANALDDALVQRG